MPIDHPIFQESIRLIQNKLGSTGLTPLQQQVLERLIHTSGDYSLQHLLRFSPGACESGLLALKNGAPILTDTSMAKAAIAPMASRTLHPNVFCALDWSPNTVDTGSTRTAIGIESAWQQLSMSSDESCSPIVVIGSSPSCLERLLHLIANGAKQPSLIIGMPVGFVGVEASKEKLINSQYPFILLEGTRGGAAIAAATVNALLRASLIKIE